VWEEEWGREREGKGHGHPIFANRSPAKRWDHSALCFKTTITHPFSENYWYATAAG